MPPSGWRPVPTPTRSDAATPTSTGCWLSRRTRPLRGVGPGEWLERLDAETGNLAAAVRWYLAHDPEPLPHLFRVLWLFWLQRDLEGQARSWVEQFRHSAGPLDVQARAELALVEAVIAVHTGDGTAALAARQRLAPLLAGIQDPFLRAACQLAMAWSLPIVGDLDGALREAAVSLEELSGQDEPVFTAIAEYAVGSLEMALGRYDDALRHLREARDLAERSGGDWLQAASPVQLGILAVLRGRLDEARALMDEALDLSLAARSTPFVTLRLAAYARLEEELVARWLGAGNASWPGRQAWPPVLVSQFHGQAEVPGQQGRAVAVPGAERACCAGEADVVQRTPQRQAVLAR